MSTKNTGKFALAYKVLNDDGSVKGVRARITDDIILKRGQTVFFNGFEEEINTLVEKNFISAQEGQEKLAKRSELDSQYNQETLYSLRAGNIPTNEKL